MALLKHWDDESGRWTTSAPEVPTDRYISTEGGTIDGPFGLRTRTSGQAYDLTVNGDVSVGRLQTSKTGKINFPIILSSGRSVDFGGAEINKAGNSKDPMGAVTKIQVDKASRVPRTLPVVILDPWKSSWSGYTQPSVQRMPDGFVIISGLIEVARQVAPGNPSIPMFMLPQGWGPPARHAYSTFTTVYSYGRVDVHPDFAYYSEGPSLAPGKMISLDGISYYTGEG